MMVNAEKPNIKGYVLRWGETPERKPITLYGFLRDLGLFCHENNLVLVQKNQISVPVDRRLIDPKLEGWGIYPIEYRTYARAPHSIDVIAGPYNTNLMEPNIQYAGWMRVDSPNGSDMELKILHWYLENYNFYEIVNPESASTPNIRRMQEEIQQSWRPQ